MSDSKFGEEAATMPSKAMNLESIKKMVEELLEDKLKENEQSKGKDKTCDDESEEENKEKEAIPQNMELGQKMFLDALKLVNMDNVEINRSTRRSPFEVAYGLHPKGILELRDLGGMDKRSAQGEDFTNTMKEIHEQVKPSLQQSADKYKIRADVKRRYVQFKVGNLVMDYLRKERLPKGQPSKLLMKKIGFLWVVHKFGNNAYEFELPADLGISPIFNVCDLIAFKGSLTDATPDSSLEEEDVEWMKDLPPSKPLELECFIDSKVITKTRKDSGTAQEIANQHKRLKFSAREKLFRRAHQPERFQREYRHFGERRRFSVSALD
ncbi:uncharacterized protein LOC131029563 [Cryptomeria japonica]|uniref:uncharacterized protein LOC131029563 n=1 Tax=Cryptomeria japonica TaxID=3369 RepID=UPI0027D9E521|nr:uncharacterized protein LOC131029563 [Cryptomeria japonica]